MVYFGQLRMLDTLIFFQKAYYCTPDGELLHTGCQITAHRMSNYCIRMLNYCISDVSNYPGDASGNYRDSFEKNEYFR